MRFCQTRRIGLGRFCTLLGIVLMLMVSAQAADVVLVVDLDDPVDEAGNESLEVRLGELGHTVEVVDDDDSQFFDPTGKDLIVISSSVLSGNVGTHFTEEPIPLINWESALWDELAMSDSGANIATQFAIEVIDTGHPLAQMMGLTDLGPIETRDWETTFHGGRYAGLAPDAVVIAEQEGGGDPLIAVVDQDGELRDGSFAAATRIGLFLGDEGLDGANEVGVRIFDGAVNYALGITGGGTELQPGDANQDLDFNQLDIVQVQISAKYLTGQAATWGEGDWDGGPGGEPGSPPPGNGLFDQLDIVAALSAGKYLTGPYGAIPPGGSQGDDQTSVVYNAITGEVSVDAPASTNLTSINIDSASGTFASHEDSQNLDGSFDNHSANNIFKATFGSSFGSLSFGLVAQPGLAEAFVADDLTVVGSLEGGGGLGDVDLVYIPEPSGLILLGLGLASFVALGRRRA